MALIFFNAFYIREDALDLFFPGFPRFEDGLRIPGIFFFDFFTRWINAHDHSFQESRMHIDLSRETGWTGNNCLLILPPPLTGEREADRGPRSRFRVGPDTAPVCLHDGACKIQTQPGAFGLLDRARRTVKTIEDGRAIAGLDAGALVADAHQHLLRP